MKSFVRRQSGSILLEAAIAFPVLIALLLGITEFGEAFTVKRRNALVAATAADLVTQVSCVTTANLQDVAAIGGLILAPNPYTASIAGLSITSVTQNASNATVSWSWSSGTLVAGTAGNTYALPSGLVSAGNSAIVVQAAYKFTPAVGNFLTSGVTFSTYAYNKPRLGASVVLQSSC
jgi:Flp pilus assembly protein TadG